MEVELRRRTVTIGGVGDGLSDGVSKASIEQFGGEAVGHGDIKLAIAKLKSGLVEVAFEAIPSDLVAESVNDAIDGAFITSTSAVGDALGCSVGCADHGSSGLWGRAKHRDQPGRGLIGVHWGRTDSRSTMGRLVLVSPRVLSRFEHTPNGKGRNDPAVSLRGPHWKSVSNKKQTEEKRGMSPVCCPPAVSLAWQNKCS